MTGGVLHDASMVSTVVRVRDVAASVAWFREKLGWNRFTSAPMGRSIP